MIDIINFSHVCFANIFADINSFDSLMKLKLTKAKPNHLFFLEKQ